MVSLATAVSSSQDLDNFPGSFFFFCLIAGLSYSHIKYTPLSWQSTQSNKIYLGKGNAWAVYSTVITKYSDVPGSRSRQDDFTIRSDVASKLINIVIRVQQGDMPNDCNALLTFLCWRINFTVGGGGGGEIWGFYNSFCCKREVNW